uniref:Endonuclease/exonuclease/phosphatase domain-containing protein n=1 Tax=Lactuca sativa TaxID=4236 RepID=A0A9R1ULM7_LACSA|nr:hypothetical protein LSAT_V11C800391550 [Lactuca sativa]
MTSHWSPNGNCSDNHLVKKRKRCHEKTCDIPSKQTSSQIPLTSTMHFNPPSDINAPNLNLNQSTNFEYVPAVEASESSCADEETQISNYSNIDVKGCWDATEMDFEGVDSARRSSGLVMVIGSWVGILGHTIIANIYGPQTPLEKKALWRDLMQIKQNWSRNWLLFGDFNVVRRKEESFSSQFCEASARDFNQFIHEAGIQDFNMGGEQFTYMSYGSADAYVAAKPKHVKEATRKWRRIEHNKEDMEK